MTPIYIKLGTAVFYEDERLGFLLDDSQNITAGVLDYNNLTPEIFQGLIAGTIVQISEEEYYGIVNGPIDPLSVDTNYLITLTNYIPPCPTNGFVMFGYFDSKWWKITWETIKACLASTLLSTPIRFRVGNPGNPPWVPIAGTNTFQHNNLIGITDFNKLTVSLNGVELYHKDLYPVGEQGDYNWYDVDDITGDYEQNVNFEDKDIIHIR